jgi:hypothetical protein
MPASTNRQGHRRQVRLADEVDDDYWFPWDPLWELVLDDHDDDEEELMAHNQRKQNSIQNKNARLRKSSYFTKSQNIDAGITQQANVPSYQQPYNFSRNHGQYESHVKSRHDDKRQQVLIPWFTGDSNKTFHDIDCKSAKQGMALSPGMSLSRRNSVGDIVHRNNDDDDYDDDDDYLTITSPLKLLMLTEQTRAETKVLGSKCWMERKRRNGNVSKTAVPINSNMQFSAATSPYQEAEEERDDTSDNSKQRLLGKLNCFSPKAKDPDIRQMHDDD